LALPLSHLGLIAYHQGNFTTARALFEERLAIGREVGSKQFMSFSLQMLGRMAYQMGDYLQAGPLLRESLALSRETGRKQDIAGALTALAALAGAIGHPERATRLFGAAEALLESMSAPLEVSILHN
jgi:tetratricopeptide (TPR) repeat protein